MTEVVGAPSGPGDITPVESPSIYADLLLALIGHDGDIFVRDKNSTRIQLSDLVDWIPDADRPHFEALSKLGGASLEIQAFIDYADERGTLYQAALATGMEEVLQVYQNAVLDLEHDLQEHPRSPVILLSQKLEEFQTLLPAVARLARFVRSQNAMGTSLLRAVHAAARCGDPTLESCAERLSWHCNGVVLRQLHAWCLHGRLADGDGEFFLQRDDGPLMREEGGKSHNRRTKPGNNNNDLIPSVSVAQELPPGISQRAASSSLFIGKSVCVLFGDQAREGTCLIGQGVRESTMSGRDPKEGSDQPSHACREALARLASDLVDIGQDPVPRPSRLEQALERAREALAHSLWELLRGERLAGCLSAMRDYFLLQRSDFWTRFLEEAAPVLDGMLPQVQTGRSQFQTQFTNGDVPLLFQQAALGTSAEEDGRFSMFSLEFEPSRNRDLTNSHAALSSVDNNNSTSSSSSLQQVPALRLGGAWPSIHLRASVPWPMQVLFSPTTLDRYDALWRLSLHLRRADDWLVEDWIRLVRLERGRRRKNGVSHSGTRSIIARLLLFRHRLAYTVLQLRTYLHTDLAALLSEALSVQLSICKDVAAAEAAHEQFVSGMVAGAFLRDGSPMASILQALLDLVGRLHSLVRALDSGTARDNAPSTESALQDMERELELRTGLMLGLLRSGSILLSQHSGDRGLGALALAHLTLRLSFHDRTT